ncbi:MAG TPA: MarR family winged helix-turn-helix transcriptional regulator [Aggregatilineaceae bacterium]|nr:MarR family winged helix-turn-helix transcriptional regulator [Aggregatilineaceae bacterium]
MHQDPSCKGAHRPEVEQIMADIFNTQDMSKFDLFRKLMKVSNLLSHLASEYREDVKLSPARMRLLIRLAVSDRMGNDQGLLPSELSRFLGVSRNTVSALLNGLEEQGLIERHLHPTDRRQFLIRITPGGHDLVCARAPEFGAFVASMFEVLSLEERATLLALLDKLYESLRDQAAAMGLFVPGTEPEVSTQST